MIPQRPRFSRRLDMPLLMGLLLSILFHIAVLLPLIAMAMTSPGEQMLPQVRFDPEDLRSPPPPPDPDDIRLGIDTDSNVSTLTWVGYEEYEEHLAALSKFDQAAFSQNPSGGLPPTEPTPVTEPAKPVTEVPESIDPKKDESTAASSQQKLLHALEELQTFFNAQPSALPISAEPVEADQPSFSLSKILHALNEQISRAMREAAASSQPPDKIIKEQTESKTETPATPTKTVVAKKVTPNPPAERPDPGDAADKESDPTSTVEVSLKQMKLGKPLAARGLELKPVRPDFTVYTRQTAWPANPLVEIHFKSTGVPSEAIFIETSGDTRVDDAIRASLYRWKAKGKPLDQLGKGETINVRIRIVLVE